MKQISKNKISLILKRIFFTILLLFVTTFLQTYWSMGKFSKQISSGCMDCLFCEDVILISLLSAVFISIFFLVINFIGNKYIKIATQWLVLIAIWFFWNYTLFVDRESSWSTYLFWEEILNTASFSFFPILLFSILVAFLLNRKDFTNSFTKKY